MCGRYSLAASGDDLVEELELEERPADAAARYNVAPSQDVPGVSNESPRRLLQFRWGLVPFWDRDRRSPRRQVNVRAESLARNRGLRHIFRRRRCLLPADGFYEWKRTDRGKRPVYYRLASGRVFTFAGVWEPWEAPAGERLITCAIVTRPANEAVRDVHDRMPVIVPRDARRGWLEDDTGLSERDRLALLRRLPDEPLQRWFVGRSVNSPGNEGPALIEPVEGESAGS